MVKDIGKSVLWAEGIIFRHIPLPINADKLIEDSLLEQCSVCKNGRVDTAKALRKRAEEP